MSVPGFTGEASAYRAAIHYQTVSEELAGAIVDCVDTGARVLNLSAALAEPSSKGHRELEEALDYAASLGAISVAAAGNQGMLGSSAITRHPSVVPAAAWCVAGDVHRFDGSNCRFRSDLFLRPRCPDKAIPRPEKTPVKEFAQAAEELFDHIMQMTDNAGATDEHRTVTYLAVRYHAIYAKAAEEFAGNASLTGVDVRPSPLSGTRRVLDVIFSYTTTTPMWWRSFLFVST